MKLQVLQNLLRGYQMKLFKTNLVQAQEDMQETNEMVAIIESYKNKIINSMAAPSRLLGEDAINSHTMFQSKPTLIKIDVTKLP